MSNNPAIRCVREFLSAIGPADGGLSFGAELQALPLSAPDPSAPVTVIHVREAFRAETITVEELERASVPELKVINKGERPVFLPAGAVLLGGAQTRIVANPLIIRPGAEALVSVRCVERGRWNTSGPKGFRGLGSAPMRFKTSKLSRDSRARMRGAARAEDQHQTWTEVDLYLSSKRTVSHTSSLADGMEAPSEAAVKAPPVPAGARGLMVRETSGTCLAWELYGDATLAAEGLAYTLEGLSSETGRAAEPLADTISPDDIRAALDGGEWKTREEGGGTLVDFSLAGAKLQGTAVVHDGAVLRITLVPAA